MPAGQVQRLDNPPGHRLGGGKDFESKPGTMIALARAKAKKQGLKLRAQKVEGGIGTRRAGRGHARFLAETAAYPGLAVPC
jgi:hypothetical protein